MAYLHCHSCGWSQDDFWTKHYNPLANALDSIKWLAVPRMLEMDRVLFGKPRVFSWVLLASEIKKYVKVSMHMKWWTESSWERARKTAVCPKCGKRDFDID